MLSKKNCEVPSNVAKARIHVPRVIAGVKHFKILNGAFPITLKDLCFDQSTITHKICETNSSFHVK